MNAATHTWDYVDVNPIAGDVVRFEAHEVIHRRWSWPVRKRVILKGLVVQVADSRTVEIISGDNVIREVPTTHVVAIKREVEQ